MSYLIDPDLPFRDSLAAALRATEISCEIARDGQLGQFNVSAKSVGDYVSEVDVAMDHAITEHLQGAFPEIPVISEELCPEFDALPEDCWIVDPLDGTNSYLARARLELTSSMIALRLGGKTVAAVVRFPFTAETYYATLGGGAFRNGEAIRVPSPPAKLSESWVALNHYGDQQLETSFFVKVRDHLRSARGAFMVTIDPPGSGLALRILDQRDTLAAVIHDNNPVKRKQELWDVVPIKLIVEQAGGVYLNDRGQPYDPIKTEPIIIAASKEMAEAIMRLG